MLCSTNLHITRLHRVYAAPFFKPEYKKSLVPFFAPPFQNNFGWTSNRGREIFHKSEEEGSPRIQMLHPLVPTLVLSPNAFPQSFQFPLYSCRKHLKVLIWLEKNYQ